MKWSRIEMRVKFTRISECVYALQSASLGLAWLASQKGHALRFNSLPSLHCVACTLFILESRKQAFAILLPSLAMPVATSAKSLDDAVSEETVMASARSQFLRQNAAPTRPPPTAGQLVVQKNDMMFIQSEKRERFYGKNPQDRMFAHADKEGDRFFLDLQSVYQKNGYHKSHSFTSLLSANLYFQAVRSAQSVGRPLLAWETIRSGYGCKGYLDVEVNPRALWTGDLAELVPLILEAWNTVLVAVR